MRQQILRGELAIGEVVSRRKVATLLGFSVLPVGEAFLRLQIDGLLECRSRVGTRVRVPTREDVEGHFTVREGLEVQGARLFALNAGRSSKVRLLRLAVRIDALSKEFETNSVAYLTFHEELHKRIAEETKCTALCDAIKKAQMLSSAWLHGRIASMSFKPPHSHRQLLDSLVAGDPVVGAETMRWHLQAIKAWMLELLAPDFQNRGHGYRRQSRLREGGMRS